MKIKLPNKYYTAIFVFSVSLGLISCNSHTVINNGHLDQVKPVIVGGKLIYKNKKTNLPIPIIPCRNGYDCDLPNDSRLLNVEKAEVEIKTYQAPFNSVLCTVTFEGPGYSYKITWEAPESCS